MSHFSDPTHALLAKIAKGIENLNESVVNQSSREGNLLASALAENIRLKAEVERLTKFTTRTIIPNEILQAQVERLECAILTGNAITPDATPQ